MIGLQGKQGFCSHLFRREKLKLLCRNSRKQGVTFVFLMDSGEEDGVDLLHGFLIEHFPADDKYFLLVFAAGEAFCKAMGDLAAGKRKLVVGTEYNVLSSGKGSSYRLEGLPTHDDPMSHGGFFKVLHLFWNVPGDPVVNSDHPVCIHGSDKYEFHCARFFRFHGSFVTENMKKIRGLVVFSVFFPCFCTTVLHYTCFVTL